MRSSPPRPIALAGVALAATVLGCASPQSFIVLVLESSTTTAITDVAQVTVEVSKGTTLMQTLSYGAGSLSIVPDADVNTGTLSVSFSGNESGDITFRVTALNARGCAIGVGAALVPIKRGSTNEGIVPLAPELRCPPPDGGSDGDAGGASTFPGCDPVTSDCPTGQSCEVACDQAMNLCTAAGSAGPGESCGSNLNCAAGSQCFDYTTLGCATKICLPFCGGNADCAAHVSAGLGPGSFCRNPVVCASGTTAYHTCSLSCDPTAAAAAANRSGCPASLGCVIPGSMDQVDCACLAATRTGKENSPCSATSQCAAGFLCEETCRAICRCAASGGACTAANDCPTSSTKCTPVPGQTIYGVCL